MPATMESTGTVLVLFSLLGIASTQFYGESFSFMTPQKDKDGNFEVSFFYRSNGRGTCEKKLFSNSTACVRFENAQALQTDKDVQGKWCQAERIGTATVPKSSKYLTLSDTGCCWPSNVNGKSNWTVEARMDLGTRSDIYGFNRCPVTASVASLRVPQNCFSKLPLLAYDPDGDHVRCRFAAGVPANITQDVNQCTITTKGPLQIGVHVFELVLEDYSKNDIKLSYADGTTLLKKAFNASSQTNNSSPFCQVSLQFTLEIISPLPNCVLGHVLPQFLYQTPSHGDIHHASVGEKFQLYINAQATHATIKTFQVSGPLNMTKEFKNSTLGKADASLSWTPQLRDLNQFVPICFTAETNESQSETRCIIVIVTKSSADEGKAIVSCTANQMTVALEKTSMPDIDKNWLKLQDPSCSLTSNSTHIMGTMSYQACGTTVEDKGDFIAYKNEINSFELPTAIITRRRKVNIRFSCLFPKTISISNNYQLHKTDYVFTESSFGSFGYSFELYTSSNFTTKVAPDAYPVQVKLLEKVYMGIKAVSDLPNITMFVESCKGTPNDNPINSLSYSLLENGCLKDDTFKVYPSRATSYNFEIQAFKFNGNYDQVYITCSVILCELGNPFSRCAQGCLQNSNKRRKRGLSRETAVHYITQGPIRVGRVTALSGPSGPNPGVDARLKNNNPTAADLDTSGGGGARAALSTNWSTMVFGSLFFVTVLILAIVIGSYTRKYRADDRKSLLATVWEN